MKKSVKEYLYVALGSFLLAVALNVFLVPNKISTGGVSTLGTVFLYTLNIPLSVTNLFFNIILFVFGYKYLGKSSVSKTVAGIVFLSVFLSVTDIIPLYTFDFVSASVAGGVFAGVGLGMVLRCEASTGGSDFAALILKHFFPHMSLSAIIMVIDFAIIIVAGVAFKSIPVTVYSALTMFISMRVADFVITLGNSAKSVYVISDCYQDIAKTVLVEFDRGVTGIFVKGMYTFEDKMMLLCIVSPKEVPMLVRKVAETDKKAFIIISDVHEVVGEGF